MNEEMKQNLKNPDTWTRFVYMLLFLFFLWVAGILLIIVVSFQFIVTLITASPNDRLKPFGRHLSYYLYSIMLFLTYNTEDKPYPFSDWPADK